MTAPVVKAVAKKTVAKKPPVKRTAASATKTSSESGEVSSQSKSRKPLVTKTRARKAGRQIASAKRSYMPRIRPAKSAVRYRQMIAAEIIVGSLIIITDTNSDDPDSTFSKNVKAEAAFLIAMTVLSLLTVGGPSMARVSATLGGLLVLTMLVRHQNVLTKYRNRDALPALAQQIETGTPQVPGSNPKDYVPPNNTIPNTGGLPYIPGLPQGGGQ